MNFRSRQSFDGFMATARTVLILGFGMVALLGILAIGGRDVVTPSRPETESRGIPHAPEIVAPDVPGSGVMPPTETAPESGRRTVPGGEVEWIVVTDEVGVPLPDAYLVLEGGRIRRGDPAGRIRKPMLGCGCHCPVWVEAPGRERLMLQDAMDDGGHVVLRPGGAVEGVVVDHHGVGLPGARIDRDEWGVWDSHVLATSDGEGRFRVDHLPIGEPTRLRASGAGWVAGSDVPFAAMEVSPGDPPVRLVRPGLGLVRLRFEWTPEDRNLFVRGVALDILDETMAPSGPLNFDLSLGKVSDGVYESAVPAGRLSLWVYAPPGAVRFLEGVLVEADRSTAIEFPRLPVGRLAGTIRDEVGEPVAGARVTPGGPGPRGRSRHDRDRRRWPDPGPEAGIRAGGYGATADPGGGLRRPHDGARGSLRGRGSRGGPSARAPEVGETGRRASIPGPCVGATAGPERIEIRGIIESG